MTAGGLGTIAQYLHSDGYRNRQKIMMSRLQDLSIAEVAERIA
jgi:hypothetical protein